VLLSPPQDQQAAANSSNAADAIKHQLDQMAAAKRGAPAQLLLLQTPLKLVQQLHKQQRELVLLAYQK
jgi:hypothetical protein